MNKEELKKKIADLIYDANWHFELGGGPNSRYYEVDAFYLDDEDEVIEEIIKLVKEE